MINRLLGIMKERGYRIFRRPFELNLVGIRNRTLVPNTFNDEIHVFYKDQRNRWRHHQFPATTDPGSFYLVHFEKSNPQGVAVLKQGQYHKAYEIGYHKGQYKALTQKGMVTVYRDYDRDAVLDFMPSNQEKGRFGINIHRASAVGPSSTVDRWSAGCQVLKDPRDFDLLMRLAEAHKQYHGNSFSYTLIDFREMRRETYRRLALGASFALPMLGFWTLRANRMQKNQFVNGTICIIHN